MKLRYKKARRLHNPKVLCIVGQSDQKPKSALWMLGDADNCNYLRLIPATKFRNTRKSSKYRDSAQTESLFYFSNIHHKTAKTQEKRLVLRVHHHSIEVTESSLKDIYEDA